MSRVDWVFQGINLQEEILYDNERAVVLVKRDPLQLGMIGSARGGVRRECYL